MMAPHLDSFDHSIQVDVFHEPRAFQRNAELVDLKSEPLQGDVRLADIWPSQREVAGAIEQAVESGMYRGS